MSGDSTRLRLAVVLASLLPVALGATRAAAATQHAGCTPDPYLLQSGSCLTETAATDPPRKAKQHRARPAASQCFNPYTHARVRCR